MIAPSAACAVAAVCPPLAAWLCYPRRPWPALVLLSVGAAGAAVLFAFDPKIGRAHV